MRVKQTKTEKKVEKKVQPLPRNTAIEVYFKDPPTIKVTLTALADLGNHPGWRIIQSYLNENKKNLINQLRTLTAPDAIALSRQLATIQNQLGYIDYLLTLPDFLISSYREDIENSNLDPYNS